ncbi:RHS repeat protein [Niabella drilacis]|uniref:YD repeat-containing protein n=1 Tax=Niabella drilacis (strain DSM 25811 / CCM 8410 / CCUG 62505 / LMG 26954 / E90) TaxID=1285928 RepID=A0A1G6ZDT6_NIADE|nr:RHS repeat domain-containing protein [Niabella drilacis]SDE00764.1 YD repeat-containing protein [Niabella drilacis]
MKITLFLTIILLTTVTVISQVPVGVRTLIPPSPNVGSLLKFTESPVSKFNGLPEISLPVYTIKGKGVEFPIKLMYHSGGVKVTEAASWVGMSWALVSGGVISQSIRGVSDLSINGRFNTSPSNTNALITPSACELKAVCDGRLDSEPDIFYFNVNGKSGEFFFDDSRSIQQMYDQKLKITTAGVPTLDISSWIITDLDGTQYIFEEQEQMTNWSRRVSGATVLDNGSPGDIPSGTPKSWLLTKIKMTNGDFIYFNYESSYFVDHIYNSDTKTFQDASQSCPGGVTPSVDPVSEMKNYQVQKATQGRRLQSIDFPGGTIRFITGASRCDIYGDKFLDKIIVEDNNGAKIEEVILRYKYFIGNNSYLPEQVDCSSEPEPAMYPGYMSPNTYKDRRLFLVAVDQIGQNNNKLGSYTFEYENSIGLPNRFSSEQDWWGFYNGNGYSSLLQNLYITDERIDNINRRDIYGRSSSFLHAKQGSLKKISYPTGGYTEFEYELNSLPTTYGPSRVFHPEKTYTTSGSNSDQPLDDILINNGTQSVTLSFEVTKCIFGPNSPSVGFYIKDLNSNTIVVSANQVMSETSGEMSFSLSSGSYRLFSYAPAPFPCTYTIKIRPWSDLPTPQVNYDNGGLRVKKITSYDPVADKRTYKLYDYTELINGNKVSTGRSSLPYSKFRNDYVSWHSYCISQVGGAGQYEGSGKYLTVNSTTNYPLSSNQNNTIGYSKVTERTVDDQNNDLGYTLYEYTNLQDYLIGADVAFAGNSYFFLSGSDKYPWEPILSNAAHRGKPLRIEEYKKSTGGYKKIRSQKFTYTYVKKPGVTYGFVASYSFASRHQNYVSCQNSTATVPEFDAFRYSRYHLESEYDLLSSVVTEEIDDMDNTLMTSTVYEYNEQNLKPSKTTVTNSTGTTVMLIKYPNDFNGVTGVDRISSGIKALQDAYALNRPIEHEVRKKVNQTDIGTVSSVFNSYNASNLEPDRIYSAEFVVPVVNFSSASVSSGTVVKDNRYRQRVSFDQYDTRGNILEQQKSNNVREVYLWGYDGLYPVAKIVGSDNAIVGTVITQAQIDAAINNDQTLRTLLNTLRIDARTKNALVTTYTYMPLVGMTSETDPSGRTIYYEYDSFGRLNLVKDDNGRILKKICYNYAGQPVNCN